MNKNVRVKFRYVGAVIINGAISYLSVERNKNAHIDNGKDEFI